MDYMEIIANLRFAGDMDCNIAADAIENLLNEIHAQQEIMEKQAKLNAELTKRVLELEGRNG